jgi:hypothetical protein
MYEDIWTPSPKIRVAAHSEQQLVRCAEGSRTSSRTVPIAARASGIIWMAVSPAARMGQWDCGTDRHFLEWGPANTMGSAAHPIKCVWRGPNRTCHWLQFRLARSGFPKQHYRINLFLCLFLARQPPASQGLLIQEVSPLDE